MKYPVAAAILFAGLSYASWHLTGPDTRRDEKKKATPRPTPAAKGEPFSSSPR